jgi:hypothetical protein
MNDRVGTKRIIKLADGPVHDVTVQGPFKKGRDYHAAAETDGRPINKMFDKGHEP